MVRHRIIVGHSGRWERSEDVDGDEQLVTMSSDKLCFNSLVREVHKLLWTDPNMIEIELFYLTSTNTGRRIRASLQDDGDLLDLLHEQTTEMVVYVISRQLEGFGAGPSMRDDYVPCFPHVYEGTSTTIRYTALGSHFPDEGRSGSGRPYLSHAESSGYFAVADGHMWRIYKFNGTHTCYLDMGRIAPRQVLARVLGKYFGRRLVDERVVLKPKEMMVELVREFSIHIDYSFALRTRNIAIQMVYGNFDKSYPQLPAFRHTLQLMNPGTVVDMEITSDGRFKHSFLALGACVNVFLQYARPVFVIDGTHLKRKNKRVLFVVVTKDGNEQILPVAVGLGPIENDESWIWFLAHLHMSLGDIDDLLIVSDQHQSIKNAVQAVFPRATHGLCYYHLKNKITKRGKHVTTLFQEVAYAYRRDTFQESMSTLEQVCPNAYQKLCNIGPVHWSRSYCPVRRYGFMTSNTTESLNARLLWTRKLPVCSLFEMFRSIVEQWFVERRMAAQGSNHVLTDGIALKLSGNVDKGRSYAVRPTTLATLWKVEVGREVYMFDLQNRTCDCREFELDLILCSHAAAVICCTGGAIYDYVARYYKVEGLVGMYNSVIRGLPRPDHWIVPDTFAGRVVLAPEIRQRVGRPFMSRARASFEASSSARRQFCTRCHGPGHNRRVCIAHLPIGGVDLNSQPEDVPRRRVPKKCSIYGSTEHTRPTCSVRLSADDI
ncbi:hypothetical protein C2S53_003050 [Perilla frutescens var. hirtella]|uniref:SWIM-type domain-containing protein n=1 Tax=Perilla frutescens var. hirtella TaxID=608512 RepID=A0AAD4PER4_PERFH|nr:hypothetical protein C2S53_003050 [Perilla frutescens var. hirtella]